MLSKGIKHMLVAGIFFSFMNVGVKYLDNIPAIEIVFFRSLVTLVISAIMIKRLGISFLGNNKSILFLRGLFGLVALSLYFLCLQKMPFASAVTIMQLSPIFTTILAIFILKERVALPQWFFFLVSFAGVAIIKGFNPDMSILYFLLAILAAFISALAYNMIRKLKDTDHPLVVVFYFPLIALPVAGILTYFKWVQPNMMEYLILIGIGISTQIAQVNMTKALQLEEVGKVSIVRYLTIVYAIVIGYVFFKDDYGWITLLGISLVVCGVLLNLWFTKVNKAKITA
ncbi:MAG: DMT family transporter [Chitinophagales bacterium]|jgi:drug/metabolite transporter (DMT)-like permease|nr:DMT family transporter [Chitinophagales bacterium]|tara:strand:- start:2818 stop:3672 length:855 start_codon:yes stop_codon:yes gene_type:complete